MNIKQYIVIAIFIISIVGTIGYLDMKIDKEEGINVYHLKGENFNSSKSLGSIQVSPGLNSEIIGICFMVLILWFCITCFVLGGGLKLFKDSSNAEKETKK